MRSRKSFALSWKLCVAIFLCPITTSSTDDDDDQASRYLVWPTAYSPTATRVQLLFGLGLPMDTDVSTIIGYVFKLNYALPSDAAWYSRPYVRYARSINDFGNHSYEKGSTDYTDFQETKKSRQEFLSRRKIYKIIESLSVSEFQSGKVCLLKAICELASVPLHQTGGIFAQLLHIFLTPSTTSEPESAEYLWAEKVGQQGSLDKCRQLFEGCDLDFLSYFTVIR